MLLCLFTALSVGGATIVGTAMGFPCRKLSHRFSDIVLAFAAGVMLSAAILGLILPAISYEEHGGLIVTICGIFAGAGCISLVDRLVPHIHKLIGWARMDWGWMCLLKLLGAPEHHFMFQR